MFEVLSHLLLVGITVNSFFVVKSLIPFVRAIEILTQGSWVQRLCQNMGQPSWLCFVVEILPLTVVLADQTKCTSAAASIGASW
jgi:hypothetical protein